MNRPRKASAPSQDGDADMGNRGSLAAEPSQLPQIHGPPRSRRESRPAPEGTRYDHLARTPLHRWWRPLVGALVVVVATLIFQLIVLLMMMSLAGAAGVPLLFGAGDRIFDNRTWDTAYVLLALAVLTPAALLAARWVQRRPAGSVSSVTGRLRRRWLLVCAGAAVIVVAVSFSVSSVLETGTFTWVGWQRFAAPALVVLALVPLQAAGEEYLLRGWLPQAFGAYFRTPWPGIVVSAALFALIHSGATESIWGFADLMLFAAVLAVLTIRTGGLEAPIALHTVWNYVGLLTAAAVGEQNISALADYSGADWQGFTISALTLGAFAGLVLWLAKRRGVVTMSGTP